MTNYPFCEGLDLRTLDGRATGRDHLAVAAIEFPQRGGIALVEGLVPDIGDSLALNAHWMSLAWRCGGTASVMIDTERPRRA